ncbi:MAG: S24 family peptidase [Chloroflexi bacterium]|nr:S24 family peptidase [Chloroflexota bacterium]
MRVRGESMGPTLPDDCSTLFDRDRREGRVYVVRTDGGLIVKRAAKHGRM